MTAKELRRKYIDFFKSKGHAEIKSAPLIPENDPTVLFTTAGMHPLVPYLMGEKHPLGKRLVNYQKCIRTGDIEDVLQIAVGQIYRADIFIFGEICAVIVGATKR